jgi:chorismate dehydratase
MKRYVQHSGTKMALHYRKNVPSQINKALKSRHINGAFISSIESPNYNCTDLGIIAHKSVYSVFVIEGANKRDHESATSNRLAKVLNLKGEVLIGDKALTYYLNGGKGIDLATEWYERTNLPFVFARLCYNCYGDSIKKMANKFMNSPQKVPQYILKKEAKRRDITPKQLLWYLEHIEYKLGYKSKKSLKLFLKKASDFKIKNRK